MNLPEASDPQDNRYGGFLHDRSLKGRHGLRRPTQEQGIHSTKLPRVRGDRRTEKPQSPTKYRAEPGVQGQYASVPPNKAHLRVEALGTSVFNFPRQARQARRQGGEGNRAHHMFYPNQARLFYSTQSRELRGEGGAWAAVQGRGSGAAEAAAAAPPALPPRPRGTSPPPARSALAAEAPAADTFQLSLNRPASAPANRSRGVPQPERGSKTAAFVTASERAIAMASVPQTSNPKPFVEGRPHSAATQRHTPGEPSSSGPGPEGSEEDRASHSARGPGWWDRLSVPKPKRGTLVSELCNNPLLYNLVTQKMRDKHRTNHHQPVGLQTVEEYDRHQKPRVQSGRMPPPSHMNTLYSAEYSSELPLNKSWSK